MQETDLPSLQRAFPALANTYFVSLMILTVNFFSWLSFAAFFSAYEQARIRARMQAPSVFRDFALYVAGLPHAAYVYLTPQIHAAARWLGYEDVAVRYLPVPPGAGMSEAVPRMLRALQHGALGGTGLPGSDTDARVTAPLLVSAFRISPEAAIELLKEAVEFVRAAQKSAARAIADAVEPSAIASLVPSFGILRNEASAVSLDGWRTGGFALPLSGNDGISTKRSDFGSNTFRSEESVAFQSPVVVGKPPSYPGYQAAAGAALAPAVPSRLSMLSVSSSAGQSSLSVGREVRSATFQVSGSGAANTELLSALQQSVALLSNQLAAQSRLIASLQASVDRTLVVEGIASTSAAAPATAPDDLLFTSSITEPR